MFKVNMVFGFRWVKYVCYIWNKRGIIVIENLKYGVSGNLF